MWSDWLENVPLEIEKGGRKMYQDWFELIPVIDDIDWIRKEVEKDV